MTEQSELKDKPTKPLRNQGSMPQPSTEQAKHESAREALEAGDKEKIDKTLANLHVSTTESGEDQTSKPDTEGSTSSSKNLYEQGE